MGTTPSTRARESIVANLSRLASDAALSLAESFDQFGTASFISIASLAKAQAQPTSDASLLATKAEADPPAVIGAISSKELQPKLFNAMRVDPGRWKTQIESCAIATLTEACSALRAGDRETAQSRFDLFAGDILHARSAGPISAGTLDRIADLAAKNHDSISLIHLGLESNAADKLQLTKIFLAAKLRPDFVPNAATAPAIALATTMGRSDIMQALIEAGAKPMVQTVHLALDETVTPKRPQMNVWDARQLIQKLSSVPKADTGPRKTPKPR